MYLMAKVVNQQSLLSTWRVIELFWHTDFRQWHRPLSLNGCFRQVMVCVCCTLCCLYSSSGLGDQSRSRNQC